jgi:hypothetical protein
MRHALRAAAMAILGTASLAAAALAQAPGAAGPVSIVQGTVQAVDSGRHAITLRDDSGAVHRLSVARAAQASLARVRTGAFVILSIRGGVVTSIDARGVAATPPPQEVPQLPPGAAAPQNRAVPQLPPGNDAPQSRAIPQVPAVSPAPVPRPSISPVPVSPRPSISPRPVSPRPAVSPVTGPTPRPVPIPSPSPAA